MPSEDPINPEWNRWFDRDESGRLREIAPADRKPATRKTAPRAQAAHLQKLAARIGVDAETLAERIPEDTLRRLKYPMLDQTEPDGTHTYKHDVGIIRDGRRSLLATDHAHGEIETTAPQPRDDRGKFVSKS